MTIKKGMHNKERTFNDVGVVVTLILFHSVRDKVRLDIPYMVLITCKKCKDINYLTSKASGNLTDFGYKCRYCNTINRMTLEDGELKKQE
jgi:RNase P subunit RPR2